MSGLYLSRGLYPQEYLQATAAYILKVQRPWGEIPWFEGGHTDPWDHVEAAMGLSIAGENEAAHLAYRWLAENQLVMAVGGGATATTSPIIPIGARRIMSPTLQQVSGIIIS